MKFDIYSRKSLFTGKGESIDNQIEICKNYILSNFPDTNESDIFVFEDEGYSGKNMDRPEYIKMRKHQEKEKIDYIVVYRLDRISRNVSDFSSMMEELRHKGIGFISVNEKFDTSTPMGRAMITIAAVFAQLERETIAERVKDNMFMLARDGRWLGGRPPVGYSITIDDDYEKNHKGEKKEPIKRLIINEDIYIAKLMYDIFLEKQTLNAVSKEIISKGIRSYNNKLYSLLAIKDILRNPIYCIADDISYSYFAEKETQISFDISECDGERAFMPYGKRTYADGANTRNTESEWVVALGRHEGIISGEDWVRVQKILENNKLTTKKRNKQTNLNSLFSGMIICKKCGARMFAKKRSGKGSNPNKYDYICNSKIRGGKSLCDCKNLLGNEVDESICKYLLEYCDDKSLVGNNLDKTISPILVQSEIVEKTILRHRQVISKKTREIENLITSLQESENLTSDFIKLINNRVGVLQQEITIHETEISKLQSSSEQVESRTEDIQILLDTLKSFKQTFEISSVVQKREALRIIIDRIEWDGENLSVFI